MTIPTEPCAEDAAFTMSVGRDYRLANRYEYCIFEGELLILRSGCFKTSSGAKRAGLKAVQAYAAASNQEA